MREMIKKIFLFIIISSPLFFAQPNPFNYDGGIEGRNTNFNIESNKLFVPKSGNQQYGSRPQLIAIMPRDTLFVLPLSGAIVFEVRIGATDADGTADIDSVWFCSRKSSNPNYPFYLTRSSYGFWFMMLQFTSQNRADTYPFVFFAKDREGNVSDSLVHYVTLMKYPYAVNENKTPLPGDYKLMQNFPNPFNPSTTIKYKIASRVNVSLKVFDLYGKEAAVLVNQEKEAGEHSVKFDASGLSTGMYFYKLTAGSYSETRKLVLIK